MRIPKGAPTKILGFTGTSKGMTRHQKHAFSELVSGLLPEQFHHGDCIGADAEAHEIVRRLLPACQVVLHPPLRDESRAFCDVDVVCVPAAYIKRNRNIVLAVTMLLAAPFEDTEQRRGGTWSTLRYALKSSVPVILFRPDGSVWLS